MEKLQIPKKDKRVKMLTVPVTIEEHEALKKYCLDQNVTLTSLIRYALKETCQLKMI